MQYFPCPGATHTIVVPSYIWWTEHIGLALLNAGYNVLFCIPLYLLHTDPNALAKFDTVWNDILAAIKNVNASLIIGGNTSALCPHVKTGQLLHDAAGLPVIHYWWDEIRTKPSFTFEGFAPDLYLSCLRNPRTLNCIWDIDVLEEMQTFHNIQNVEHLPLAMMPEFWPSDFVPMQNRPVAACFLGNCHHAADWTDTDPDPLTAWARSVIDLKQANLDRPMRDCLTTVGPAPLDASRHRPEVHDPWTDFRLPWEILNAVWMHRTRNQMVKCVADALGDKFVLIGKGWEHLGLHAIAEHANVDTGSFYQRARASLNLFGGCVHGGMPLRPFDIAASGGLLLTHYARELPTLFEPGTECLSFRTRDEMCEHLSHAIKRPADFNPLALAGRQRALAHHTWSHRVPKMLEAARQRLAWNG